jgi:hypothetical protein
MINEYGATMVKQHPGRLHCSQPCQWMTSRLPLSEIAFVFDTVVRKNYRRDLKWAEL